MTWEKHSNDSHQCPILAADFVIFDYGIENEQAIQAGTGSEWGIEIGCVHFLSHNKSAASMGHWFESFLWGEEGTALWQI